ncbi:hypothetical protein OK016_12125 [Vibrio chagasii]|nr:hypothetical protein [Vibrio chagasii]
MRLSTHWITTLVTYLSLKVFLTIAPKYLRHLAELADKIAKADGYVMVSPENNHSMAQAQHWPMFLTILVARCSHINRGD